MRKDKTQCGCAPNVLNEWTHGDLLHARVLRSRISNSARFIKEVSDPGKEALNFNPADYSLEEGAVSYNWMAHYTLEFLEAYLKHEDSAVQFIKHTPSDNGVAKHLMAATFRLASAAPEHGDANEKK